jgi:hypothetical protein
MPPPPTALTDDLRLLEPPHPWLMPLLVVAAIVLVAAFFWWRRRRGSRHAPSQEVSSALSPPVEDALAELEKLFALIDSERSRPYGIESSAIVRRYIERRFEFAATLQSTEEFLADAQRSPRLDAGYQDLLGDFLSCCDLLKFARTLASRDELAQLHNAAIAFVKGTAQ